MDALLSIRDQETEGVLISAHSTRFKGEYNSRLQINKNNYHKVLVKEDFKKVKNYHL